MNPSSIEILEQAVLLSRASEILSSVGRATGNADPVYRKRMYEANKWCRHKAAELALEGVELAMPMATKASQDPAPERPSPKGAAARGTTTSAKAGASAPSTEAGKTGE